MSRFVVVVNEASIVSDHAAEYGGDVLEDAIPSGDQVAAVVKFDDDEDAGGFSRRVNGTVFRSEWTAREHARHKATGSP
jgi:hypothetical protein